MKHVIRQGVLQEIDDDDEDIDFEIMEPDRLMGPHVNGIPNAGNVQSARHAYGSRFFNQMLALENGEEPLVQNLAVSDRKGRSYDDIMGEHLGAKRYEKSGVVTMVDPDFVKVKSDDGEEEEIPLYNHQYFNQKSGNHSRTLVKVGDKLTPGSMVAASIYTNDKGTQSMGVNARIGLVPWNGFSIDDAVPISESFAKRLSAIQYKVVTQDKNDNTKLGLSHFQGLFPQAYEAKKLSENFTADGIVKPGTVLQPGDPIILATMPRTISSAGANVGKLSKATRQERRDASEKWEGSYTAEVVRAIMTKNGPKVVLRYVKPAEEGDKITLRAGAKGTISKIIPDDRMPRTEDGQPLELLLNPLSLKSRANAATAHELRLGKIAKKLGQPLRLPSFLPKGTSWQDKIRDMETENGISAVEKVFDPDINRFLSQPVTVGYGFVNKLHHTAEGKSSVRGVGSYDQNEQPAKGSSEMAQAKRYSGLENYATLSSGAYSLMRDNNLRGSRNDAYWRAVREGKPLPKVGTPFAWNKFRALLTGSGMKTQDMGKGKYRLRPFTDEDLDETDPVEVENGDIVRLSDMSPIKGGLFDSRLTVGNKWGRIKLPRPIPNPAMEDSIRVLLGLTNAEYEDILEGRAELPDRLR